MKVLPILLLLPLVFLVACGTFRREWRRAVESPPPDGWQGPWEGEWRSEVNGHHGKLRCVIRAADREEGSEAAAAGVGTPDAAAFHYWARWGIFSGSFRSRYPVERAGVDHWRFRGSSDLGWLGGVYDHEGEIKEGAFRATYRSAHDRGTMVMQRPPGLPGGGALSRAGGEGRAD